MKRTFFLILFGVIIFFIVYFITYRERLKQQAIAYVIKQVERDTGWHLELGNVDFSLPCRFQIDKIKVFDNSHPLLTAKDLKFTLTLLELLNHRVVFDSIQAEQVFLSAPNASTNPIAASSTAQEPLFPWKTISFYTEVHALEVHHFFADPNLIKTLHLQDYGFFSETNPSISFKGKFVIDPSDKSVHADLALAPQTLENATHLTVSLNENLANSSFQLHFTESDNNSFIARAFNLPNGYVYQGIIRAEGPYEAWHQLFDPGLALDGTLLTGDFQFSYALKQKNEPDFIPLQTRFLPLSFGNQGSLKGFFSFSKEQFFKGTVIDGIIGSFCFFDGTFALSPSYQLNGTHFRFKTTDTAFLEKFQVKTPEIRGESQLSGAISQPDMTLKVYSKTLEIQEKLFEEVVIQNHFKYTDENEIQGTIALQGKQSQSSPLFPETDFSIAAEYRWDFERAIDLSKIKTNIGNTQLAGDLHIALPTLLIVGDLAGHFDLSLVEKPLGQNIQGTALTHVHFSNPANEALQQMELSMQVPTGTIGAATVNGVIGKLIVADLWTHPSGALELSCQTASTPMLTLGNIAGASTFDFSDPKWPLSLSFQMELLNQDHSTIPLTGVASVAAQLSQDSSGVTGHLQIEMANVKIEEAFASTMPLQATFKADLNAGLLECTGHVVGMGPEPINLTATLPVTMTLSPPTFLIEKDKLNGHLSIQSQLGSLLEFFSPVTITHLTGHANISLDLSGTLSSPQIKGFAKLTEGSCEFLDLGLGLKNIKAHAALDGTKITLSEFQASDGGSGTIVGNGTAKLDANNGFPFDLFFQINHVALLHLPSANLSASGKLNLKGNRHEGALHGKIITDGVKMMIPEQIPSLAQTVEVTYINQDASKPAPTVYIPKNSIWPVALNFELEMPKGIIIGQDWSSEWKGNVLVSGTADAPLLNGTYKIISGEYRFNGKSFEINQGTITFAGDPEKKTSLYVIASNEIENIKIEIILKGALKDPVITFRSNPPLSQREILSWILFNKGLSEITPFQGTELSESITHLNKGAGKSKKPDMLTRLRNQIGIDRFDINREENGIDGGVSVEVGKYISRGVLVSVNKGITNQSNKVAIEASVFRNFKVQAEVGDDSEGELLLKWKKDY